MSELSVRPLGHDQWHMRSRDFADIQKVYASLPNAAGSMDQKSFFMLLSEKTVLWVVYDLTKRITYYSEKKRHRRHPIIGFGTVNIFNTARGGRACINDINVHADSHGRGAGKLLVQNLVEYAFGHGVSSIELTSNPKREAARGIYESLGFVIKDTDFFILRRP